MTHPILRRVQDEGICSSVGMDDFFPYDAQASLRAKRICAGCPVRSLCLTWALENNEEHGIWGGTSPRDRRKLKPRARSCRGGCGVEMPVKKNMELYCDSCRPIRLKRLNEKRAAA